MIKDFSKYAKIINNFRGEVLSHGFDAKFAAATKQLPKSESFLLKMELKRLAQPCTRLIDLRGLVDGECKTYEHNDRPHYLDDIAIKVFEENVAYYGGYTFGVYEAVTNTENNFRVIYQREKSNTAAIQNVDAKQIEKTQYPAKLYNFGPYYNRIEERMNFAIPFEVTIGKEKTECVSSDLSVNGCKFRLTKPIKLAIGDTINIRFIGLEQDFQFDDEKGYSYEIKNIQQIERSQLIGTERIYSGDKNRDSFRRFLLGFIQGNKRRYKINLDNTINALQSRTFEQYLLPKINELPVFFTKNKEQLIPRYALTCHDNRRTFEYWSNESKQSTLYCLFTPERIEKLLKAQKLGKPLIVYSFIHENNGQSYFYTADDKQLAEDLVFMKQFLGFAAAKNSFAITQLSLLDVEQSYAHSPITLSESLEKKDAYLNEPFSKDVLEIIANLAAIGVVTDITTDSLIEEYRQFSFEGILTDKLKRFGHKRQPLEQPVDAVGINYSNHRNEPRFFYTTPVVVEADKVTWKGTSKDFSISGMKVELEKSAVLMKGDIVYLTFPNLQKITSSFELAKLPYEVMRINKAKTIVNLRVHVKQHQHIGRSFFKLLIEKNKDKLTADEYVMMTPGLAKSLRNIYSRTMLSSAVVIQTSGSRYKFEALTSSKVDSPFISAMNQLSDKRGAYNLYPLLKNHIIENVISQNLKKQQVGDAPFTEVLYIAIDSSLESLEKAVITKVSSELASAKLKQMFISNALKKGLFFCIEIKVFRVDKPDIKHLNPELSYVGSYAIHRGKQLEQEIYSVAGMMQFYDITQEAMLKHKLQLQ
ncbi:PilZ domain-containing protein [Thalassotalea agariperforans]